MAWLTPLLVSLLAAVAPITAPGAQGTAPAPRDRAFEAALTALAEDWFEARPATRFEDWDPAVRGPLEERARALGALPDGQFERAVEILFETAQKAAIRQRSKSRANYDTPWGKAWAHLESPRAPEAFLLGLHGGGEGVGDAGESKGNWTVKGVAGAYPQAVRLDADAWNTVHGERFALTLMEHAKLQLAVDPDRIYVAGFSMGGTGSWHLAGRYPDWLAGAIPAHGVIMASPRAQAATEEDVSLLQHGLLPNVRNLVVYAYTGLDDTNCMPGTYLAARTRVRKLIEQDSEGYQGVQFTFHEGLAHAFPAGEPARGLDHVLAVRRDTFPTTLVWEHATDPFPLPRETDPIGRLAQRHFYWLHVPEPVDNMQIRATRSGNSIDLTVRNHPKGTSAVRILLHPEMVAPGQEIAVTSGGKTIRTATPPSNIHTLLTTFDAKVDRRMVFDRVIELP